MINDVTDDLILRAWEGQFDSLITLFCGLSGLGLESWRLCVGPQGWCLVNIAGKLNWVYWLVRLCYQWHCGCASTDRKLRVASSEGTVQASCCRRNHKCQHRPTADQTPSYSEPTTATIINNSVAITLSHSWALLSPISSPYDTAVIYTLLSFLLTSEKKLKNNHGESSKLALRPRCTT